MAKRKQSRPQKYSPPSSPKSDPGNPRIWLYGSHAVIAALANPARKKHRLILTKEMQPKLAEAEELDYVLDDLKPEILDRQGIDKALPPGAVHQGIALLVSPLAPVELETVCESAADDAIVVVLDQANDPRNIGAVLRSAAAFGAVALVVPDRHTPEATAVLAKAASGALDRVPLIRVTNLIRSLETLKKYGFWCAGLDGGGDQTIDEAGLDGKIVLILGAEGSGLRKLTAENCDYLVNIPIDPRSESLNLSAAAAISLYELRRKTR